jgi:hypothetical protein
MYYSAGRAYALILLLFVAGSAILLNTRRDTRRAVALDGMVVPLYSVAGALESSNSAAGVSVTDATRRKSAAEPKMAGPSIANAALRAKFAEEYGNLPLSFEANQGQSNEEVRFLSRGNGYVLLLTSDEAILQARRIQSAVQRNPSPDGSESYREDYSAGAARLHIKLLGENTRPAVSAGDELPGRSNYFIGKDPSKWHTNIPNYGTVRYQNVYSGIDLIYYGNQGHLEFDFVVSPGTDPKLISLAVSGTAGPAPVEIDDRGDLIVHAEGEGIRFEKPVVYQHDKQGQKRFVEAHYVLRNTEAGDKNSTRDVSFDVGAYDKSAPLIIDPAVSYATLLGGSRFDAAGGIAVDTSGNAYVTGIACSANFPVTKGAFQVVQPPARRPAIPFCEDSGDVFVSKLNAVGSSLLYSTYLGGIDNDAGLRIALDSAGHAYITGLTTSVDFPTTVGAFQTTIGGGVCGFRVTYNCPNGFVTKLSPNGSALAYSTYLGGNNKDFASAIAVDSAGDVYLTGYATSTNFPTTAGAFKTTASGGGDAFVVELNPSGSAEIFGTYLGGTSRDYGTGIAADASGVYVSGSTHSSDFPVTAGAFQTTFGGSGTSPCYELDPLCGDAFVAKLKRDGSGLIYATFVGGSDDEAALDLALDSSGSVYITGETASTNFPTSANAFQKHKSLDGCVITPCTDAFITKLNATGSALEYSTYLGGTNDERALGIAADSSGDAWVTGGTLSKNFPLTSDAFSGGVVSPNWISFITELKPDGSGLLFSSFLGSNSGGGVSSGTAVALDNTGKVYVAGVSNDFPNFPTTPGGFQTQNSGGPGDAYIVQIAPLISLLPTNIPFGSQAVGSTSVPIVVTLKNSGTSALSITAPATSGDFAQINNCGSALPAGGSCQFNVTFKPTTFGARTGFLTVADSATRATQAVSLSGTGTDPNNPFVMLSSATLTFDDQPLHQSSAPQILTVTNVGGVTLAVTSITVSGDFAETNTCANSLAPGAHCSVSVTFTPSATAKRIGAVSVTDNASGGTQTVALTGFGTRATPPPLPAAQYLFGKANFGAGVSPIAALTGDFNSDGILDLAILNQNCYVSPYNGIVSILLGKPDGTFAPKVDYASTTCPVAITAADFNGDGKLDLVVSSGIASSIAVLMGKGDGSFNPPVTYALSASGSSGIATGDFNGDGRIDLAVGTGQGASVLLGNGDGSFMPSVFYSASASGGGGLVVGDFNGDGKLDLAIGNSCCQSPTTLSVLLGKGDGTFLPFVDYSTGANSHALAVGDFNGDGKLDLAAATGLSDTVAILLGKGDGTFGPPVQYGAGNSVLAVVTGDFNGDGKLDLAVNDGTDTMDILLGKGDGTFQNQGAYYAGRVPGAVALGDFNRDGQLDMAVPVSCVNDGNCNTAKVGAVSVFIGKGDGTFQNHVDYGVGDQEPQTAGAVSGVRGDFNGDGILDLAVADHNANAVSVRLGKGDGTFLGNSEFATGNGPQSVTIGDFNGDGKLDLVTANNSGSNVSILLGNGDGTFQAPVSYSTASGPYWVASGDFNADGKLDLAVADLGHNTVSILLGKGDGTFQPHVDYATGKSPQYVSIGDFNKDGFLDLAVATGANSVSILLGKGDGTFQPHVDYATQFNPISIAIGDFNRDGKLDLAVANECGSSSTCSSGVLGSVSVLLGNGDGTFQAQVPYNTDTFPFSVTATDVNDDGRLDLVTVNTGLYANTVSVLEGRGDGTFGGNVDYGTAGYPRQVFAGDFNRDGAFDLAIVNEAFATVLGGDSVSVWLNLPVLAFFPGNLNFPPQKVGTTSQPKTITLNNPSSVLLSVSGISVTGTNATDFSYTSICGKTLQPGASCTITVTFTPRVIGNRSANLTTKDSAPGSPQLLNLTGVGD